MSLSNAYENLILDHLFGLDNLQIPLQLEVGLIKNPLPFNESDIPIEPSPSFNYSRITIDNNKTTFTSASVGGGLFNAIEMEFPVADGGSWGDIYFVGFFNPNNGDLVAYGDITDPSNNPVQVNEGTKIIFPPNNINILLD